MYAEFAHDPKVQRLSEADQRRYIMLLCLRCSNSDVTLHKALHDDDVTFLLRVTNDEWQATKAVLIERKLIDQNNLPTSWDKRQFRSDSSAERVARHREAKKQLSNGDVTLQKRQSNALDTDTDTDTEKNKKHTPKKPQKNGAFALLSNLGVSNQTANDWIAIRKLKKAAITHTALDGISREANKAGISLEEALKVCCERGWSGFKADWMYGTGKVVEPGNDQAREGARARLFGGNKNATA
jgi:hypothetical protein